MPTRITLIRHGETSWNVDGRWQGHAAVPLNDEGRRQAGLLAEHLYPIAAEITAVYSSDSIRTHQTAEAVATRLGKPIILDARLREIDLGEWQGMTSEEVEAWDGERLHQVRADSFNMARPGGESFRQVAERALSAVEAAASAHPGEHILVVSHGGTIRSILVTLGLIEISAAQIGNTARSALIHAPDGGGDAVWKLDVFNLMDHLDQMALDTRDG